MSTQTSVEWETETDSYVEQLTEIILDSIPQLSDEMPSEWTERKVVMQKPFPGPFRYYRTPYTREIIDILSPNTPCWGAAVKKGGQVGFSSGVIYPGIGWIIANNPGNTLLTVGSPELIEPCMDKMDILIHGAGLHDYIQPQVKRKRNSKTGDTGHKKDFPNGYLLVADVNNHKKIRQIDTQFQFRDDAEAVKKASKESGNTAKKLDQRQAAYEDSLKQLTISTPEVLETSNIEPAYLKGDQRKFMIPCDCCHQPIELKWSTDSLKVEGKKAGIVWRLKEDGHLDKSSVGYCCQLCDGFFTDKNKMEWLNKGFWKPTAVSKVEGYRSYHISALYAPIGMFSWAHYVQDYIDANPEGQPRDEALFQQFQNECLGECYETPKETPSAGNLQKNNVRAYHVGEIPESLSIADGNGEIVLLTLSADANGKLDDARLDWELEAWSEKGARYSVKHGSIGSFIFRESPKQKEKAREHWSYELNATHSVWPDFTDIITTDFKTDTGRTMNIAITAVDTGHCEKQVFAYIDSKSSEFTIVGVKGDKEHDWQKYNRDVKDFLPGRSRPNLYLLNVNKMKDDLARQMKLRWDTENNQPQPFGYLNFPTALIDSEENKEYYTHKVYYSHYESEHKILDVGSDGIARGWKWEKKTSIIQNHFWDVKLYGASARDILMWKCFKEAKVQDYNWKMFVDIIMGR